MNIEATTAKNIEQPYYDKYGREIKEFAVLKVYHFFGRDKKHHYMYKWVRLKEHKGKKYWVAMHLISGEPGNYYNLRAVANKRDRVIQSAEIVQQY